MRLDSPCAIVVPPWQDEDEEDPPQLLPPGDSSSFFRDVTGGGKVQFPTTYSLRGFSITSPTDGAEFEMDEVETEAMFGAFLSTTIRISDFPIKIFADILSGPVEKDSSETVLVDDGRGIGFLIPVTENFEIQGEILLFEIGVAPVLLDFQSDDRTRSLELSPAAGIYFGSLRDLEVERTGTVSESYSVSNESLFGAFVGIIVHGRWHFGDNWGLEAGAEIFGLFGEVRGFAVVGFLGLGAKF